MFQGKHGKLRVTLGILEDIDVASDTYLREEKKKIANFLHHSIKAYSGSSRTFPPP